MACQLKAASQWPSLALNLALILRQVWYVPKGARRTVAPGDSVFRARSIQWPSPSLVPCLSPSLPLSLPPSLPLFRAPAPSLSLIHMSDSSIQVWYVPRGARRTVAPGDSVFRARSIQEYLAHKKQTPP